MPTRIGMVLHPSQELLTDHAPTGTVSRDAALASLLTLLDPFRYLFIFYSSRFLCFGSAFFLPDPKSNVSRGGV